MYVYFYKGEVIVARDAEDDSDWREPELDENGEFKTVAARTTFDAIIEDALEGWRGRDGYTIKDSHEDADMLSALLRAAADKVEASKGPHEKLCVAYRQPEAQKNLQLQAEHFEKYGNGPVPEDVYRNLPEFIQMMYNRWTLEHDEEGTIKNTQKP